MQFALTKVYTKFYISQILNSISYQELKSNEDMLAQFIEENIDTNIQVNNRSSYSAKKSNYSDSKFRRLFVYNNVYYSKVELMGTVVEMQTLGYEEKIRYILYLDDGTGIISAIVWKNFNKTIFEKVSNLIVKILN